jgi:quercetin 2,3-dioxygenase
MRKIEKIYRAVPNSEGAGVHLLRGFGGPELAKVFDPFLLFDDFSNTDLDAYRLGFPQHPHRGIETVTYILEGEIHHKDSLGNKGSIRRGDVQWMSAGSGILHEEMPVVHEEGIQGFQLWVNIPAQHKMSAPRYQDVRGEHIPALKHEGVLVKVIAGTYHETEGPVRDLFVSPTYLDIALSPYTPFTYKTDCADTFFVYVYAGRLAFRDDRTESWIGAHEIGLLTNDHEIICNGGKDGARFLLIGGKPLRESISWYGPIVMNTEDELAQAISELKNGTFIQ